MNEHRTPAPNKARQEGDPFVIPPPHLINLSGHHWLRIFDYDGHQHGHIVLQWQPSVRKWCHSHEHATGQDYENVEYYAYVAPCPMPLFDDEVKMLSEFLDGMSKADETLLKPYGGHAKWHQLDRIIRNLLP